MQHSKKIIVIGQGLSGQLVALSLHKQLIMNDTQVTLINLPKPKTHLGIVQDTSDLGALLAYAGIEAKEWSKVAGMQASMIIRLAGWALKNFDLPCATDLDPFHRDYYEAITLLARQGVKLDTNPSTFSIAYYLDQHKLDGKPCENFPFEVHPFLNFNMEKLEDFLRSRISSTNMECINASSLSPEQASDGRVQSITLDQQHSLSADFYIDCTENNSSLVFNSKQSLDKSPFAQTQVMSFNQPITSPEETRNMLRAAEYGWCKRASNLDGQVLSYHFQPEAYPEEKVATWLQQQMTAPKGTLLLRQARGLPSEFPRAQKNLVAVGQYLTDLPLGGGAFLIQGLVTNIVDWVQGTADTEDYNRSFINHFRALYDVEVAIAHLYQPKSSGFWRQNLESLTISHSLRHSLDRWMNLAAPIDQLDYTQRNLLNTFQWEILFGGLQAFPPPSYAMSNLNDYKKLIAQKNEFIQRCLKNFTHGVL